MGAAASKLREDRAQFGGLLATAHAVTLHRARTSTLGRGQRSCEERAVRDDGERGVECAGRFERAVNAVLTYTLLMLMWLIAFILALLLLALALGFGLVLILKYACPILIVLAIVFGIIYLVTADRASVAEQEPDPAARVAAEADRRRRENKIGRKVGAGVSYGGILGGIVVGISGCMSCFDNYRIEHTILTRFNLLNGLVYGGIGGAVLGGLLGWTMSQGDE